MSPSGVRPGQVASPLLFVFAAVAVGCGQDPQSPSEPELAPQVVAVASGALAFRQLSVATYGHACGVTTGDLAYCWGYNRYGQLGNGMQDMESCTQPCNPRPVAVAGGLRFRQVSVGHDQSCGLT